MKLIQKIIIFIFFISANIAQAKIISFKDNLWWLNHKITKEQQKVLYQIFIDAKKYDLSWSATAIAWQESQFGKYKINLADPSCGYFHKLLPELVEELDYRANSWNMSRACEKLQNYDFSFQVFISTWNQKNFYCKARYNYKPSIWKCTVMAYNSIGNKEYYINIIHKIKALKIWLNKHAEQNPTLKIIY